MWVMPRSSSLGGVSQSPRPGRRWGSCSPFLKQESPAMPTLMAAESERRGSK